MVDLLLEECLDVEHYKRSGLGDIVVVYVGDNHVGEAELRSDPVVGAVVRLEHCKVEMHPELFKVVREVS